ncbi:hypothetical protein RKD48_004968 [Streptomyces ambofaciens]
MRRRRPRRRPGRPVPPAGRAGPAGPRPAPCPARRRAVPGRRWGRRTGRSGRRPRRWRTPGGCRAGPQRRAAGPRPGPRRRSAARSPRRRAARRAEARAARRPWGRGGSCPPPRRRRSSTGRIREWTGPGNTLRGAGRRRGPGLGRSCPSSRICSGVDRGASTSIRRAQSAPPVPPYPPLSGQPRAGTFTSGPRPGPSCGKTARGKRRAEKVPRTRVMLRPQAALPGQGPHETRERNPPCTPTPPAPPSWNASWS